MRAASEKMPTMTVQQATEVIDNCMKVLFYCQPLMRAASEKMPTMTVQQATEVIDNCMSSVLFQPLMRAASEKMPTMTVQQATEVIDNCMKVLYYRDARSLNKVIIVRATSLEKQSFAFVKTKAQISRSLYRQSEISSF